MVRNYNSPDNSTISLHTIFIHSMFCLSPGFSILTNTNVNQKINVTFLNEKKKKLHGVKTEKCKL